MNRNDVLYLINTTPKYFYLLELHIGLIRRYAPTLKWDIWIATEEPESPLIRALGVKILPLAKEESGFLNSRRAALDTLKDLYTYIVPVQEDFLLERTPDIARIAESIEILDKDPSVKSIRWMPCPGPAVGDFVYSGSWKELSPARDGYMFVFQMCIWRSEVVYEWYTRLCSQFDIDYPQTMTEEERRIAEIRANYAEAVRGQKYFAEWMCSAGEKHLAFIRAHKSPNAVYMSPWPYRPTAVVGGRLEDWAIELAKREGYTIKN